MSQTSGYFPIQKVTSRQFSWKSLVVEMWGEEWTQPDIVYEFTTQDFESTDSLNGGPYQKPAWY